MIDVYFEILITEQFTSRKSVDSTTAIKNQKSLCNFCKPFMMFILQNFHKRKALMTKLNKSMANSRVKFKRKPSKSEIAG